AVHDQGAVLGRTGRAAAAAAGGQRVAVAGDQWQGPGGRPVGQVAGLLVLEVQGGRLVDRVDHDHGDVVGAALLVGHRDQLPGRLLGAADPQQHVADLGRLDHV